MNLDEIQHCTEGHNKHAKTFKKIANTCKTLCWLTKLGSEDSLLNRKSPVAVYEGM